MNRLILLLITLSGASLLAACGEAELIVEAQQLEGVASDDAGGAQGISNLPIRLLPYDRDAIFDSLQAEHPTPEPELPDTLMKLRDAMAAAHAEWTEAEHRWSQVRDSLEKISRELEGLSRASGEYRLLFRDFQDLEPVEAELRRANERAFDKFTELQSEVTERSELVKLEREAWEDEVFAPVDQIIYEKLQELGRNELADTTTAAGVAQFAAKPGKWWVVAQHDLLYEELYWNIPVELKRGEPVRIRLTRENAQVRPKL